MIVPTGTMMTDDDERIRKVVVREMEAFIERHGWPDAVVQEALLEVAKNHLWKKGLWMRLKIVTIVAAGIGAIGSMLAMIGSFLGFEIRR
jgi:hypothetical protein